MIETMRSTSLRTPVEGADRIKVRQQMVTDSESRAATTEEKGLS